MKLTRSYLAGFVALSALGIGCADDTARKPTEIQSTSSDVGNDELGITRFVVEQGATQSSVTGFDAAGNIVGRMDLVHGAFTLTPPFDEGYTDPNIEGRKLDVTVNGELMRFQTWGFDALELPAHPPSARDFATFLSDPSVKPILDRWALSFAAESDELAYGSGGAVGYNHQDVTTPTASAPLGTATSCGGNATPIRAMSYWNIAGCGGAEFNQKVFVQHCPAAGGRFSIKACPAGPTIYNPATGTYMYKSQCGWMPSGPCTACPEYPVASGGIAVIEMQFNGFAGSCGGQYHFAAQWYWDEPGGAPDGFGCASNVGCQSGMCNMATYTCSSPWCTPDGDWCSSDYDCCTSSCEYVPGGYGAGGWAEPDGYKCGASPNF